MGDGAPGGGILLSNTTFTALHPHLAELPGEAQALYCGDAQVCARVCAYVCACVCVGGGEVVCVCVCVWWGSSLHLNEPFLKGAGGVGLGGKGCLGCL